MHRLRLGRCGEPSHTVDIVSLTRSVHPGRSGMLSGRPAWTRGHEQVWIYLERVSRLLVFIVFRLALYSKRLAAFVRVRILYATLSSNFNAAPQSSAHSFLFIHYKRQLHVIFIQAKKYCCRCFGKLIFFPFSSPYSLSIFSACCSFLSK